MPDAVPVCPDCTYPLTGLIDPRCPECGLQFDPRLLTDPMLARPRPAWERRPHVSRLWAAWRMLIEITFTPNEFFSRLQQPDRLRRAVYWLGLLVIATPVIVGSALLAGFQWSPAAGGWRAIPTLQAAVAAAVMLVVGTVQGLALVSLPLIVMLVVADLALWKDRDRFRIFFKGTLYGLTVYLWCAVLLGAGVAWAVAGGLRWRTATASEFQSFLQTPNFLFAGAMTWHFAMLFHAVLGRQFARLLPPRPVCRDWLAFLVAVTWLFGMYLVLMDRHVGYRFQTAMWAWYVGMI